MATYDEAVEWLDMYAPFFNTLVLNLGDPVMTRSVPTMAVSAPKDNVDDFKLLINPDLIEGFTVEQLAGSLGHEALHIALNHLRESQDTQYKNALALVDAHECIVNDRLMGEGFILHPDYCVNGPDTVGEDVSPYTTREVYDLVVAQISEKEDEKGDDEDEQDMMDIDNTVGVPMPQQGAAGGGGDGQSTPGAGGSDDEKGEGGKKPQQDGSSGGNGDEDEDSVAGDKKQSGSKSKGDTDGDDADDKDDKSSGEGDKKPGNKSKDGADSNEGDEDGDGHKRHGCPFQHDLTDAQMDALTQKLIDAAINSDAKDTVSDQLLDEIGATDGIINKGDMAGNGHVETVEEIAKELGTSLAWAKLLSDINPDILRKKGRISAKYRSSWHKPRRNIAHMYPDVMLPVHVRKGDKDPKSKEGNKKPLIVLALDFSGSIPRHMAYTMAQLARSVPTDLIDIECCTFSTEYVSFDHTKDENITADGGTDFSAVERFARKVAKDRKLAYPSAVVCITDGDAKFRGQKPTMEQLEKNWTWLLLHRSNRVRTRTGAGTVKQLDDYR